MWLSGAISNPKRGCCESAALNMPANLENSAVATGMEKVSFHSNPKERQCQRISYYHTIALISHASGRRRWHPTPVLLPGKSHGRRSLVGCSPWGREESDTTEQLHFHFSLSCIVEGNGNPLQCSCLENPRDRGAWWAAVCGVAQSRTRLKRLSSSSSSSILLFSTFSEHRHVSILFFPSILPSQPSCMCVCSFA